jgi:hypothetical protein
MRSAARYIAIYRTYRSMIRLRARFVARVDAHPAVFGECHDGEWAMREIFIDHRETRLSGI